MFEEVSAALRRAFEVGLYIGSGFTYSLHSSSFLRLLFRILNIYIYIHTYRSG